jgi:hypothetical protein
MKKIILILFLVVFAVYGSAEATTRALQFDILLAGLMDDDGAPLASGTVYFYAAGTTDAKNVWSEKAKTNAYTSRTLDSSGRVQCYGDGLYKIIIKKSDGTTYKTYDNVWIGATNYYYRAVTSATDTATIEDDFILCSSDGNQITITLPAAATATHPLIIKRDGSNNVVIDGNGAETINGNATYTISGDNLSVELVSDGTNWQVSFLPMDNLWDADTDTGIQVEESADEDIVRVDIGGTEQITIQDGKVEPTTDNDIDLGASAKEFKDGYFDGTVYTDAINLNGTDVTSTAAELNKLDTVTATASDIETACLDISNPPIAGDSTAGRSLRMSTFSLGDGGDAGTVDFTAGTSIFNGDTWSSLDNLADGASSGAYSLHANGDIVTISADSLTGAAVAVLHAYVDKNTSGTIVNVQGSVSSGDIVLQFLNATSGADIVLKTLSDAAEELKINIIYVTDE